MAAEQNSDEADASAACMSKRFCFSQALLGDGSVVVVEYPVELGSLPPVIGSRLVGMRNRKYGRTMMAIYCVNPVSLPCLFCILVPLSFHSSQLGTPSSVPPHSLDL